MAEDAVRVEPDDDELARLRAELDEMWSDEPDVGVRVSVAIPSRVLKRARARAEQHGMSLSTYVAKVLEREERFEGLGEWLEEMRALHGEVSDEVIEEARELWPLSLVVQ